MHTKLRAFTLVTCSVLALGACSEDTSDRVDFAGSSEMATNASGEVVTTGLQIGQNALELDDGVIYAKPAADAEGEESMLIPAGESYEFKEGGDHLMIVGYGQELPDGSSLDITFDMVPQQKVAVSGVPVRKQP